MGESEGRRLIRAAEKMSATDRKKFKDEIIKGMIDRNPDKAAEIFSES